MYESTNFSNEYIAESFKRKTLSLFVLYHLIHLLFLLLLAFFTDDLASDFWEPIGETSRKPAASETTRDGVNTWRSTNEYPGTVLHPRPSSSGGEGDDGRRRPGLGEPKTTTGVPIGNVAEGRGRGGSESWATVAAKEPGGGRRGEGGDGSGRTGAKNRSTVNSSYWDRPDDRYSSRNGHTSATDGSQPFTGKLPSCSTSSLKLMKDLSRSIPAATMLPHR